MNTLQDHVKLVQQQDAIEIMHWTFILLSEKQLLFEENIITKSSKSSLKVVSSYLKMECLMEITCNLQPVFVLF